MAENGKRGDGVRGIMRPFTVSSDIERALDENMGRITQPLLDIREALLENLRDMKTVLAQLQVDTWDELPYETHTRLRTVGFLVCMGNTYSAGTDINIMRGNARLLGPMAWALTPTDMPHGGVWVPCHTIIEPGVRIAVQTPQAGLSVYISGKAD